MTSGTPTHLLKTAARIHRRPCDHTGGTRPLWPSSGPSRRSGFSDLKHKRQKLMRSAGRSAAAASQSAFVSVVPSSAQHRPAEDTHNQRVAVCSLRTPEPHQSRTGRLKRLQEPPERREASAGRAYQERPCRSATWGRACSCSTGNCGDKHNHVGSGSSRSSSRSRDENAAVPDLHNIHDDPGRFSSPETVSSKSQETRKIPGNDVLGSETLVFRSPNPLLKASHNESF